jgi:ATP-dependent Lhr-like helicase
VTLDLEVGRAFYGGFATLQPAQRAVVEPLLAGEDVLVLSGTGTGKTEAVIAPCVQRYHPLARDANGPILLYVTPTRALANDLLRRLEPPLQRLGLTAGIRHGERNDLARRRKPDLLITTPESLDVLLTARAASLRQVQAVILDEIHLLYNTQRGFQTAVLLRRLEALLGRDVQVAGLSATVARPTEVWTFFRPGHTCAVVEDRQGKPLDAYIAAVADRAGLEQVLNQAAGAGGVKALLFVNARQECDRLATELHGRTRFGEQVFAHHASLDKEVRLATEQAFQEAESALCIATSTLELGIDIGDIDVTILYGHPGGWESFLQRAGRGSRRNTKTNLLCLLAPEQGSVVGGAVAFAALLTQVQSGHMEREPPRAIYGAVAQQLLSLLLERAGAYRPLEELAAPFAAWPHLAEPVVEQILEGLAAGDMVRRHPVQRSYGAGEQLHRLHDLKLNWGNFPLQSRDVKLSTYGRDLGTIPGSNLVALLPGDVVSFAGRRWRVRRVARDAIHVDPSDEPASTDIVYPHAHLPLDPATVEEMLHVLVASQQPIGAVGQPQPESPDADDDPKPEMLPALQHRHMAANLRSALLTLAAQLRPYVGWRRLAVAVDDGGSYHYATFAGAAMNRVLAAWAGLGRFTAGDIVLRSDVPIDFSQLPINPEVLADFAGHALRTPDGLTLFQMALPPQLLAAELANLWRQTPVFARTLLRLRQARITPMPLEALAPLADGE